jgi:hypothetical protein
MNRLSITKSKPFTSSVPTKGMITALQFGSDFWMALHGAQFPYETLRLAPRSKNSLEDTKRWVRDAIATYVKDLELISRITMNYYFQKDPIVKEMIVLGIKVHKMPNWRGIFPDLTINFNLDGEILDD